MHLEMEGTPVPSIEDLEPVNSPRTECVKESNLEKQMRMGKSSLERISEDMGVIEVIVFGESLRRQAVDEIKEPGDVQVI